MHHGNREAIDSALHGDFGSHSNGYVVRAPDDQQPPRNPCKPDGRYETHSKKKEKIH